MARVSSGTRSAAKWRASAVAGSSATEMPASPCRPVRPVRWTYSRIDAGRSKWTTAESFEMWTPLPATSVQRSTFFLPDLSAESASSRSSCESCPWRMAESMADRFRNCATARMLLMVFRKTSTRGLCLAVAASPRLGRATPISRRAPRSAGRRPTPQVTKRCSTDGGGSERPPSGSSGGCAARLPVPSALSRSLPRPVRRPSP
mmetsp:Transcript_50106/g.107069  ORF Transcript_50106/g.107069 Transcript_50106/m.107069 type:complete len:204 (+) Transcript_50106:690-1301(+)